MKIPLVNLKRMHDPIRSEINQAVNEVIDANNYINGRQIEEFENNFAQYIGVKAVIGVSSGTDALYLALKVLDIKAGDYVITVPNTFIATSEPITMVGARILFVDVMEDTANMSPEKLRIFLKKAEKKIRQNVKAIIFVNLYGNPQGLERIYDIAKKNNIALVSDAAQAHGAKINGKPITNFADITTYSFFPGKNLGAFGDAGAVATNQVDIADKIRQLRNHGRTKKYYHHVEGFNCRIDTLQAAVLDVKLKVLRKWNENRIKTAEIYNRILGSKGYFIPKITEAIKCVFHLYVTHIKDREKKMEELREAGISTGIHYPVPLHLQPAYKYLGYTKGDFPITETLAKKILSLPIDGTITPDEVEYICELM